MKVSLLEAEETRRRIEVLIPREKTERIRKEILNDLRKRVKIRGFRPGRVPIEMIRAYYGDAVEEDVRRRMVEETIDQALRELKIEPLVKTVLQFTERDEGYGYIIECEIIPQIDIGDYKGIEVELKKVEVKEEEINERLQNLRNMHAIIREREGDVEARIGDIAVIKYQGYLDGKPIKEAGTDFYPLELGKGFFLPEFENAIVGMKKGEEKEVEILFQDDYPDREIAGKRVLFKVLLRELKEKILPEISDEFAKDVGFSNLEELKEEIKNSIKREREAFQREYIYRTLLEKIVDSVEIPIPSRYFQSRVESVLEDFKERMGDEKLVEEERKKLKEEVERRVRDEIKEEIVLLNIARKENLGVSEEELGNEIRIVAEETKRPYEETRAFFEKNGLMGYIKNRVLLKKARDFLISQAKLKEIE